jgi:hypothetical protein
MMSARIPHAVRSPLHYAGAGDSYTRLSKLQAEFARVLGVNRVYVRHQGAEHFVTGDPGDTLNFRSHGSYSGRPRYDWEDRGDGILYGYLKPDA